MPPAIKRLRKADYEAYGDEVDSEEDEFEQDRQQRGRAGGSSSRRAEYSAEEDGDEYDNSEDSEGDGVGQYESDEGELIESDDEATAVTKQIAAVPFGTLLKAQKKLNKSQARGRDDSESDLDEAEGSSGNKGSKKKSKGKRNAEAAARSSKHAPMEMSSKRAVPRARQIVEISASKARDPRFDNLSGSLNPALFSNSYSFLKDAAQNELQQMRETAAKARKNFQLPQAEKDEIEAALRRMESKELARKNREREKRALSEWKKEEHGKRKEGKREFHLKRAEKKQVVLKAKFDELAADKKQLRKSIERRRKKTSQKEKKKLPNRRP